MKTRVQAAVLAAAVGIALAVPAAAPAAADEIEDTLEAALEAYRAGDIGLAKEELDYATVLMGQLKAEGLTAFLPEPLDGWTREVDDTQNAAAFGGGVIATARYQGGAGDIEVQLMAENQMVVSMAALYSNAALMGSMGQVKRINRQKLVVTNEGDVQSLIGSKVLVQISGSGAVEDKLALFERLDLEGLEAF